MTEELNRRGQLTRDDSVLLLVDHQVGLSIGTPCSCLRRDLLMLTNSVGSSFP